MEDLRVSCSLGLMMQNQNLEAKRQERKPVSSLVNRFMPARALRFRDVLPEPLTLVKLDLQLCPIGLDADVEGHGVRWRDGDELFHRMCSSP